MRTTLLTATLAALVGGAPAVAQTPSTATPHKSTTPRETFVAVLSGAYEVPEVETHATGTAELTLVGSRLQYDLRVDSTRDITGAYIHFGRAHDTAPAVADLFNGIKAGPTSGLLAHGTLEKTDLHGTTLHELIRALQRDDAYITVHTLAHPGGELRGQLRNQAAVASR